MERHHGEIIRHAVLQAGYTAKDLALLTGTNKKTIEFFFESKIVVKPVVQQIGKIIGRDFFKEYPDFFATLPSIKAESIFDQGSWSTQTNAKVFLVDDEELSIVIFKLMLHKVDDNIEVGVFLDGDSALNRLLEISINDPASLPQHIFLDLNMPVMDGHSFLENFERLCIDPHRVIKIHILTSSIFYSEKEKLKSNPLVNNYISKPINLAQIRRIFLQ